MIVLIEEMSMLMLLFCSFMPLLGVLILLKNTDEKEPLFKVICYGYVFQVSILMMVFGLHRLMSSEKDHKRLSLYDTSIIACFMFISLMFIFKYAADQPSEYYKMLIVINVFNIVFCLNAT
jgi:hypothetical protein